MQTEMTISDWQELIAKFITLTALEQVKWAKKSTFGDQLSNLVYRNTPDGYEIDDIFFYYPQAYGAFSLHKLNRGNSILYTISCIIPGDAMEWQMSAHDSIQRGLVTLYISAYKQNPSVKSLVDSILQIEIDDDDIPF